MKLRRRDVLKSLAAGTGMLLASEAQPARALSEKPEMPARALGILYDATLCIGCEVCMVACKQANNMPAEHFGPDRMWDNPRDLSASTLNIIKKYVNGTGAVRNREIDGFSFIKRQCMHCVNPACVAACPVSALTKNPDTGIVSYRPEACIGCRYCMVSCPFNVPKFEWGSPFPKIYKCQLCSHLIAKGGTAACCSSCPTGASLFGRVDDLLAEARRRLALKPGSYNKFPVASTDSGKVQVHRTAHYVNEIYGEKEMGGTQVMIMAGVPFGSLGLPDLPEDSYVSFTDAIQHAINKKMFYPLVMLGGLIYLVRKNQQGKE